MLEVITGGMFAGKTVELLRRVTRARLAQQSTALFKPATDIRYSEEEIVTHAGQRMHAQVVGGALSIPAALRASVDVIAIDEAQFFDERLVDVVGELAIKHRVIVAGLDMDWRARPFAPMDTLLCVAEHVTKLRAVCSVCGEDAGFSQKVAGGQSQVGVGGKETYEPRCRRHFSVMPPTKSTAATA